MLDRIQKVTRRIVNDGPGFIIDAAKNASSDYALSLVEGVAGLIGDQAAFDEYCDQREMGDMQQKPAPKTERIVPKN